MIAAFSACFHLTNTQTLLFIKTCCLLLSDWTHVLALHAGNTASICIHSLSCSRRPVWDEMRVRRSGSPASTLAWSCRFKHLSDLFSEDKPPWISRKRWCSTAEEMLMYLMEPNSISLIRNHRRSFGENDQTYYWDCFYRRFLMFDMISRALWSLQRALKFFLSCCSSQFLNFALMPLHLRTAFMGCCAFLWAAFLCFSRQNGDGTATVALAFIMDPRKTLEEMREARLARKRKQIQRENWWEEEEEDAASAAPSALEKKEANQHLWAERLKTRWRLSLSVTRTKPSPDPDMSRKTSQVSDSVTWLKTEISWTNLKSCEKYLEKENVLLTVSRSEKPEMTKKGLNDAENE